MQQDLNRYARQIRMPSIGEQGQRRLLASRVLVVGVGALGGFLAEFLVRAGVGFVRIVDRDVPATINLHRQIQFCEADVHQAIPKAEAAALRLAGVNSDVVVEGLVADVTARSLPAMLEGIDLVLDGTDNFETRFLLNDACVQAGIPWVYGGVLGMAGMAMLVRPGSGPCLRCLVPQLPPPGSQPTCETDGVLATAVAIVASIQASIAIRWIVQDSGSSEDASWRLGPEAELNSIHVWPPSQRNMRVRRDPQCPCCGQRNFEFLSGESASEALSLCGRNAVQVTPANAAPTDLAKLAKRLEKSLPCHFAGRLLRIQARQMELMIFPDGRILVLGTSDPALARSLVSEVLGM